MADVSTPTFLPLVRANDCAVWFFCVNRFLDSGSSRILCPDWRRSRFFDFSLFAVAVSKTNAASANRLGDRGIFAGKPLSGAQYHQRNSGGLVCYRGPVFYIARRSIYFFIAATARCGGDMFRTRDADEVFRTLSHSTDLRRVMVESKSIRDCCTSEFRDHGRRNLENRIQAAHPGSYRVCGCMWLALWASVGAFRKPSDWQLGSSPSVCVVAGTWLSNWHMVLSVWRDIQFAVFQQPWFVCRWPLLHIVGRWIVQRISTHELSAAMELRTDECRFCAGIDPCRTPLHRADRWVCSADTQA